jgi:site-specific recombinase XerD
MSPVAPIPASPLAGPITQFLDHKRVLGRRYDTEAYALRLFDHYLIEQRISLIDAITPAVIDAFLQSRPRHRPKSFNHLRDILARLFRWLVSRDFLAASPVRTPTRRASAPRIPFIFSTDQVRALVEEAARLRDPPGTTGRGATYRAIFIVLYALGLRVGEVCRLTVADVDRRRNVLLIRQTKFGKDRLVPFGPRVGHLLEQYLAFRRARRPHLPDDAPLFSVRAGRPLNRHSIGRVFRQLLPQLRVTIPAEASPPRVHDMRHSCAVATLLRWYRTGIDPATRLLHLSTFLGHVQPESTAIYLTITADLLAEASGRFASFARPLFTESQR